MQYDHETTDFWTRRLPHWEVVDGRYFVTLHLHAAIPLAAAQRIHALSQQLKALPAARSNDRLQLQRRIFIQMEQWLDRAPRVQHLRRPEIAEMTVEAIEFRHSRGDWNMLEYVVMPNHLHLFFELLRLSLKVVLEDFKRWTGHQAGKLIKLDGDRFWQKEWFDHWARSDEQCERIMRYIQLNPVKAGLVENHQHWPYGGWSCGNKGGSRCDPTPTTDPARSTMGPARQAGPTKDTHSHIRSDS